MSTGFRRTSLFNRHYAKLRKAATTQLPEGDENNPPEASPANKSSKPIFPQDAEGFDDLDEYFDNPTAPSLNPSTAGLSLRRRHLSLLRAKPMIASRKQVARLGQTGKTWTSQPTPKSEQKNKNSVNLRRPTEAEWTDETLVDEEAEQGPVKGQELLQSDEAKHEDPPHTLQEEEEEEEEEEREEQVPLNDDYNTQHEDEEDTEVTFKDTIRLTPSPRSLIGDHAHQAREVKPSPMRPASPANTMSPKTPIVQAQSSIIATSVTRNKRTKSASTVGGASSLGASKRRRRSKFEPLVNLSTDNVDYCNDDDGKPVRRSKRSKIPPLAYWRNEKVIYGRRQSSRMPVIVDVLRKDAADSPTRRQPIGRANGGDGRRATRAPAAVAGTQADLKKAGYRPHVNVTASVMDYDTHQEVERLLALGPEGVETNTVKGEDFGIQTIFTEGSFLSAGMLEFPPHSIKPSRNSSKHALVFYVIEGTLEVTIHQSNFLVGTGSQFIIPRGNHYAIRSAWSHTSRLFFAHCKDTLADS